jgi:hypothetical protein
MLETVKRSEPISSSVGRLRSFAIAYSRRSYTFYAGTMVLLRVLKYYVSPQFSGTIRKHLQTGPKCRKLYK